MVSRGENFVEVLNFILLLSKYTPQICLTIAMKMKRRKHTVENLFTISLINIWGVFWNVSPFNWGVLLFRKTAISVEAILRDSPYACEWLCTNNLMRLISQIECNCFGIHARGKETVYGRGNSCAHTHNTSHNTSL